MVQSSPFLVFFVQGTRIYLSHSFSYKHYTGTYTAIPVLILLSVTYYIPNSLLSHSVSQEPQLLYHGSVLLQRSKNSCNNCIILLFIDVVTCFFQYPEGYLEAQRQKADKKDKEESGSDQEDEKPQKNKGKRKSSLTKVSRN